MESNESTRFVFLVEIMSKKPFGTIMRGNYWLLAGKKINVQ